MFVNISSCPSCCWGERQKKEASKWGEIKDIKFPYVPPAADEDTVLDIATGVNKQIEGLKKGDCVHVMGEPGVTWYIVDFVFSCLNHVDCVYSTDGYVSHTSGSEPEFVQFRHYGGNFKERMV